MSDFVEAYAMTVPYLQHIPNSGFCGFYRILVIWRGSIYKGIWRSLTFYCILYASISAVYRLLISREEKFKQIFERLCIYMATFEDILPLNFILGFYVTQVIW